MSHPVIVGVDNTDRARDAVVLGRALAEALGAELILAHVYPFSRYRPDAYERQLRAASRRAMDAIGEMTGPHARQLTVTDTSPARGLHALAESEDARLLVTGSSHRGAVGRVFLGNVARQTLHGSPVAVAVAPLGYGARGDTAFRTIGVGLDGEAESDAALALAATLAESFGAELRLRASAYIAPIYAGEGGMAVYDTTPLQLAEAEHLRGRVDEAVAEQSAPCSGEVVEAPAVEALLDLANDVELLVLGSRGFGPAKRLLLGTTSDAVASRAACPVLVLPRAAAPSATGSERATGVEHPVGRSPTPALPA